MFTVIYILLCMYLYHVGVLREKVYTLSGTEGTTVCLHQACMLWPVVCGDFLFVSYAVGSTKKKGSNLSGDLITTLLFSRTSVTESYALLHKS